MTLSDKILEAQSRFFRLAEREGFTLKGMSLDSAVPETTLRSYKGTHGAQVKMGLENALKLRGAVPDSLLSILFEPVGLIVCPKPEDWCPEAHADTCARYNRAYLKARSADSPGGPEIVDCELADLRSAANA